MPYRTAATIKTEEPVKEDSKPFVYRHRTAIGVAVATVPNIAPAVTLVCTRNLDRAGNALLASWGVAVMVGFAIAVGILTRSVIGELCDDE